MTAEPFRISVPDDVLTDLHERLTRTIFPTPADPAPWAAGTDPAYLRELVAYWAHEFDWRAAELRLNSFPHYSARVAGHRVHFVHLRGERAEGAPEPLPLIMSHGWPSSFVEMLRVAGPLAEPSAHGGDRADAFDVVIPSLPGFMFSELPSGPFTRRVVADLWYELMTHVLGYGRFGAFGGDIGAGVAQWLGALHPDEVAGVHVTSSVITTDFTDEAPATADERRFLETLAEYDADDQGYSEIMRTRPDTVAAALIDSPSGLLSWIIDKYRAWSDCDGDLERRWDRDTVLTVATLYWATRTIGSSFRQYYDYRDEPVPGIAVPGAVTLSCEPSYRNFPRSMAERMFKDLRHWETPRHGGHFMAHEEPDQVAAALRSFFRPLR